METCFNSICNNPAEVEKEIEAPFTVEASMSETRRIVKICTSCNEQEERMKLME